MESNFVIVDANAFVFRAFHGYAPQFDSKGNDQRVLHGLLNTINDILYRLDEINYLCLVFDPQDGGLFRKSLYPAYKANRPEQDPALIRQKQVAQKVLFDYIGIPGFAVPGYEADDTIGSLAKWASNNHKVIVVSPDKDLLQLVDKKISLYRPYKKNGQKGYMMYDENKVKEEIGVYPNQIPDWLALMGDVSDNLPGLKDVGEKTAAKILAEYMSVEHLIAFNNEIKNEKIKNQVIESEELLKMVKYLATVVTDLKVDDLFNDSLIKSREIQEKAEYKNNLKKIQKYFNLQDHHLSVFNE